VNLNLDERWHLYLSGAYTSREPRLKNLYDAAESSTPDSWGRVLPQFAPGPGGRYDFTQPLVKPESLFDLEFGAGLNTDRLRGTLNLYWMEFTNEIVKSGRIDRFGQPVTGNAARTRHVGAEVSVRARLNERWEVSAAASVSRNRFIRHTDFAAGGPVVLDGNPIAGFPDLLGNLRGTYREGGFTFSLAGRFLGKQYTDNYRNQENTVDPFTVWDATLACAFPVLPGGGTVEGKLQVNNLFDALYAAYGEGAQFFVGAERHFTFTMTVIY
jgi:iron complex outermembrane receptor protein